MSVLRSAYKSSWATRSATSMWLLLSVDLLPVDRIILCVCVCVSVCYGCLKAGSSIIVLGNYRKISCHWLILKYCHTHSYRALHKHLSLNFYLSSAVHGRIIFTHSRPSERALSRRRHLCLFPCCNLFVPFSIFTVVQMKSWGCGEVG